MNTRPVWILIAWLMGASSLQASPGPSRFLVDTALRALSSCVLPDPAAVLSLQRMGDLAEIQAEALYAPSTEDDRPWGLELAIVAQLRRTQSFDIADVYAADCAWRTASAKRKALGQLRPADPVLVGDLAFVPLLSADYEYLGPGLLFVREPQGWRLMGLEMAVLGSARGTAELVRQLQTRVEIEDEEQFAALCVVLPPAPMPRLDWQSEREYLDEDPKNAAGAAQRLAALRHASGNQVPQSAVAQLILAEILLRSLEFDGAPEVGSPRWLGRIAHAERLIASAQAHDLDWVRFSPLLVWLAQAHAHGHGGLTPDPLLESAYLKRALDAGDDDAQSVWADPANAKWDADLPMPGRLTAPTEAPPCGQAFNAS